MEHVLAGPLTSRPGRRLCLAITIAIVALVGCAPVGESRNPPDTEGPAVEPAHARQLVVGLEGEPKVLSAAIETTTGAPFQVHDLLTQSFASIDEAGNPQAKLLAELPSLDRGTWTTSADGSMVTRYRLRERLYWHDGEPVTVEDVSFSFQVYRDPGVPVFTRVVGGASRVEKLDPVTFDVYWRESYAFADQITQREFTVLPRHLLGSLYGQDPAAFINAAYWTDGFIGTGPFRLQSWERGSHMELRAFEHFFLGQPRTDRIIIQFVADQNTMTALVLAGELDMTMGGIDTARAAELAPRVQAAGIGTFVFGPNSYSHWTFQYNNHPSAVRLRDGRVRRAMAHALDRVQLAVFATAGLSPPIDSWIPPNDPRYRAAERIITRYPYDPQRALALFAQAGWTPGSDRLLRNAAGEPLQCDIRGAESVGSLGAKNWNEVGIETTESAIPPHLARDTAWRATFPCVEASSRPLGLAKITHLHSTNAMSAENGWRGNNRSGWSMPELDQAIDRFLGSVREAERLQAERDMVRLVTAELPVIPLYLSVNGTFLAQGFVGWNGYKQGTLIDPSTSWNAHLWERS